MRTMRDLIERVSLAVSSLYSLTRFSTDAYTRAVVLVLDETLGAGTTTGGAYHADSPWSAFTEIQVLINGSVRWVIPGYFLAALSAQDQRYAAWYTRTGWAASTALVHDCALRINFCPGVDDPPLPPGTVIEVRVSTGSMTNRVTGGLMAYTSGELQVFQEIDTEISADQAMRAKNFPFIREVNHATISDLTTAHANFHDLILPSGGLVRQFMLRVISNSALADSIVLTSQVEYESKVLTKEIPEQLMKSDWVRKTGLAAATGYLLISGDVDGDNKGFFETYPGKRFLLRIKNAAATTNGSMQVLIDRMVPKAG